MKSIDNTVKWCFGIGIEAKKRVFLDILSLLFKNTTQQDTCALTLFFNLAYYNHTFKDLTIFLTPKCPVSLELWSSGNRSYYKPPPNGYRVMCENQKETNVTHQHYIFIGS